jgi:excisionase family DNA binding protein
VSPKTETRAVTPSTVVPLAYSVEEVAVALRVSPRTIRNLLREGQLVRRKIGARTVIPVSSVESFLRRDHATGQEGTRKKGSGR